MAASAAGCSKSPEELKSVFLQFDKDKDGSLTTPEFEAAVKSLGAKANSKDLKELVTYINAKKSGKVSLDEFNRYSKRLFQMSPQMQQMYDAFTMCDADSDGYVTLEELKKLMVKIGEKATDEQLQQMMKEADKDNDNRIDFDEFANLLKKHAKKAM